MGRWVVEMSVVGGGPGIQPLFRNEERLVYTRALSSNIQVGRDRTSPFEA